MNEVKKILNENLLSRAIMVLCLLQVAIFRYLYLSVYTGLILDLLIVIHIVLNKDKYNKVPIILFLLVPIYFLINYLICGGSLHEIIGNLRDIFPAILLIPYSSYLYVNKKEELKSLVQKLLIPVNIYFLLNALFVQLQLAGYTFLSGVKPCSDFVYKVFQDSGSGLMGLYGTPLLALFYLFTFLLNLKNIEFNNIKHPKLFALYNVIICIYTLYISKLNDNKLFYVLLAVVFVIYILFKIIDSKNYKNNKLKYIFTFIIGVILLAIVIANISYIRSSFDSMYSTLVRSLDYKNNYSSGSGERIAIILYFLNELNLVVGYGLGKGRWTESYFLGFRHFGINDLSSILCLGGFILLILYLLSFIYLFKAIFKSNIKILIMVLLTLLTLFLTQIMVSFSGIILFLGICLLLGTEELN